MREAIAEVEFNSGTLAAVFTSGTIVQGYLLDRPIPQADWYPAEPGDPT